MSTPPPVPEWTLSAKDTHGSFGQLLVGCHIIQNSTKTAYLFTKPDIGEVLASSPGTTLPTASFTFDRAFDHNGLKGVVIGMKTPVAAGTNWSGQWSCTDSPPPPEIPPPTGAQTGDFTAQAGSGLGEEEAASSAKA
jgi:hypothetical protein